MAALELSGVEVFKLEDRQLRQMSGNPFALQVLETSKNKVPLISLRSAEGNQNEWSYVQHSFAKQIEARRALVFLPKIGSFYLGFASESDCIRFVHFLDACTSNSNAGNVFDNRTDSSSSAQYFQFYSLLSQQQNMLQDFIRTSTYQRAIISNPSVFQNAAVLDVGAGSGILSFFAIQAGARKVYAVEASSMAKLAEQLVAANGLSERLQVIEGKMEEITLPEPVDVIVSEPLGYMLLNERMLETFLYAKRWLKPTGRMFPSEALLFCAPFTDEYLYMELGNKAAFWYQQSFYGIDLSSLREDAMREYFRQPVVDTFDIRILVAQPERRVFDFGVLKDNDLTIVDMPLDFIATSTANVHGLAFWFDVAFIGSDRTVWLSTSPTEPLTHWYQVRCLFPTPIFAQTGDRLVGRLLMTANARQSYDVHMELEVIASSSQHLANVPPFANTKASNVLDLKSPYFRYTQVAQVPPGNHQTSPTEHFFWGNAAAANNNAEKDARAKQQVGVDATARTKTANGAAQPEFVVAASQPPQQFPNVDACHQQINGAPAFVNGSNELARNNQAAGGGAQSAFTAVPPGMNLVYLNPANPVASQAN